MTSCVSSHSVLLLYVFDDSCDFPVLFQVQNIMSNHHLLTTVQWLDSRGLFLVIISPRKGSLSLFSGYIVKLSEGWISFSVDKKAEADETSDICWGFLEIPLIESRHLVLVFQFFFNMAHKRICHQWSERRAHGNLIHLPVKISVELENVFFYVFLFFCFLWC